MWHARETRSTTSEESARPKNDVDEKTPLLLKRNGLKKA